MNKPIIIRSRAPLRLGLAGGGTDVSPYSDKYGGCVLNATINMYANCTLELRNDGQIFFNATDIDQSWQGVASDYLPLEGDLLLHKAVYNRIIKDFSHSPIALSITTYSQAPPGSGLGSSSTMVVTILNAFVELLNLPLGEYDIARLAYEIEREDCMLSGGKQDQYAATFGGFNFMEFNANEHVIVNPLRVKNKTIHELEAHLLLYFTGISRESAAIIDDQNKATLSKNASALDGMHRVKQSAYRMKEALLLGDINAISEELKQSWQAKKKMSKGISNDYIEEIHSSAIEAGAMSAKLSGAGGGGFMMLLVEPKKMMAVCAALENNNQLNGKIYQVNFTKHGVLGWKT